MHPIDRSPRTRARTLSALLLLALFGPGMALAGGVGVSDPPCPTGEVGSPAHVDSTIETIPFHLYKVPYLRAPHASRDYDFLWSDTYVSRFGKNLEQPTGPQGWNDLDRLGETQCEIFSNPLGLPWSDLQLAYNYLAKMVTLRDDAGVPFTRASTYTFDLNAPVGFRVNLPYTPDIERNHLDTYVYARSFNGFNPWPEGYLGDGSNGVDQRKNYGLYPSEFLAKGAEDSLTGHTGDPVRENALQIAGPYPSQVGDTNDATRWTRSSGPANGQLVHESMHAVNGETGAFLHMFASGAEVLAGVNTDPPVDDVDYNFSLSPTAANEGNAYPHWQSFMAWLAFNWRGGDTTSAGWSDDLLRRWGTDRDRDLRVLAKLLTDAECVECRTYPGFMGQDSVARVQRLIHDWRVASYVNNPNLSGGHFGYPLQFGFSPAAQLGQWQSINYTPDDDWHAIPPDITLGTTDVNHQRWYTNLPVPSGPSPRALLMSMYGAEYFVFRADPGLASSQNGLLLSVRPQLLRSEIQSFLTGSCTPFPNVYASGRLTVSVVTYSAANGPLFQHPEWATAVFTRSLALDSIPGDIEFEIPAFGTTNKAALLVISLGDGNGSYYSIGDHYREVANAYPIQVGAALRDGSAIVGPQGIVTSTLVEDQPAWSPDGQSLAYRRVDAVGRAQVVHKSLSATGTATALHDSPLDQWDPAWSPRGGELVLCEGNASGSKLWRVDLASGQASRLTRQWGRAISPAFSPTGAQLAYLRLWSETVLDSLPQDTCCSLNWQPPTTVHGRDVRVVDWVSGADTLLLRFEDQQEVRALRWSIDGRSLLFSRFDEAAGHYRPYELDRRTRVLVAKDQQAGAPRSREQHPGAGPLLVEDDTGVMFPIACPPPEPGCGCAIQYRHMDAQWIALRDTSTGSTGRIAYCTGARFSDPRWSPDGTKILYVTTQNGNADVYATAVTSNRAPVLSSSVQSLYSITGCVPFELALSATDPDGDPITYEVFDLPAGAQLQGGNNIYWGHPVIGDYWLIARALDPQGAVGTRLVHVNVYDDGGCGGGGGEDDPGEVLPGGHHSAGRTGPDRLVGPDGYAERGVKAVNSFLDGAASGAWVAQRARLMVASADSTGLVRTRLVALRPGVLKADRVRLLVVDHEPNTVAVATAAGIAVGTRKSPARMHLVGGVDLTGKLTGLTDDAQHLAAGTVIELEFPDADDIAGLVVDCARASAVDANAEWGLRVEVPEGAGWRTAGRLRPRSGYDALAVEQSGLTHGRLVFLSDTDVRSIAGFSLDGAAAAEVVSLPCSGESSGDGTAALADADSVAIELGQGTGVTMEFAGPAPVPGKARSYFLDLVASFTPVEQGALARQAAGEASAPARFELLQNRPNPFEGGTTLRFDVPRASRVRVEVFDAQGRRVRTLADQAFAPGEHSVAWDGTDASGRRAGPGVYLYRMTAPGFREQRRMVLLGR